MTTGQGKIAVMLVGGSDVDLRIPLMKRLREHFSISAAGSSHEISKRFEDEGFEYHYYPLDRGANPIPDLVTFFRLFLLFRQKRPYIVHAFDTKPCVYARMAARAAGVPIVIGTLPGLGTLYTQNSGSKYSIRRIYEMLQKFAGSLADLTIFQNRDDWQLFTTAKLVAPEKTAIILGSGVDSKAFSIENVPQAQRHTLRQELHLPADAVVVSMITRLIRSKGIPLYADAAREIHKTHPSVRFLLIGPKDQVSTDGLSDIEIARLAPDVQWLNARRDVATILAISDIFVLPSTYREGIPRVLLEAAAMGLPIITANSPGCKEVVEAGVNGTLLDEVSAQALSTALQTLVESPETRHKFGTSSRQRAVELFDIDKIAQQTQDRYLELLDKKPAISQ